MSDCRDAVAIIMSRNGRSARIPLSEERKVSQPGRSGPEAETCSDSPSGSIRLQVLDQDNPNGYVHSRSGRRERVPHVNLCARDHGFLEWKRRYWTHFVARAYQASATRPGANGRISADMSTLLARDYLIEHGDKPNNMHWRLLHGQVHTVIRAKMGMRSRDQKAHARAGPEEPKGSEAGGGSDEASRAAAPGSRGSRGSWFGSVREAMPTCFAGGCEEVGRTARSAYTRLDDEAHVTDHVASSTSHVGKTDLQQSPPASGQLPAPAKTLPAACPHNGSGREGRGQGRNGERPGDCIPGPHSAGWGSKLERPNVRDGAQPLLPGLVRSRSHDGVPSFRKSTSPRKATSLRKPPAPGKSPTKLLTPMRQLAGAHTQRAPLGATSALSSTLQPPVRGSGTARSATARLRSDRPSEKRPPAATGYWVDRLSHPRWSAHPTSSSENPPLWIRSPTARSPSYLEFEYPTISPSIEESLLA